MVLTNFELWAADGSSASALPLDYESNTHTRHLNPFDTRVVPQLNTNLNHLSSNGYYGFSYINSAHISDNNNNNNNISNNNNNNNLSGTAYNLMTNDVNGMNNTVTTPQQTHASSVNFGSSAYVAGNAVNVARCKKRYFVINDDGAAAATVANNYEVSAKRCRFDDDLSAQYCNDFFQLPSTQIATQSCLMDIEEAPQQQQQQQQHMLQQQVVEAMFENNNNNVKSEQNTINRQLENVQTLSAPNHQQQTHSQHSQQQPEQQQQQQNLYHHQQHYQDIHATITNHSNNNNHFCDTLTLNNNTKQTCQIILNKTENVFKSLSLKPKNNQKFKENEKFHKTTDDNVVVNAFKVDDATLFAQLHGGCLHHHEEYASSSGNYKSNTNSYLNDEHDNEEF